MAQTPKSPPQAVPSLYPVPDYTKGKNPTNPRRYTKNVNATAGKKSRKVRHPK